MDCPPFRTYFVVLEVWNVPSCSSRKPWLLRPCPTLPLVTTWPLEILLQIKEFKQHKLTGGKWIAHCPEFRLAVSDRESQPANSQPHSITRTHKSIELFHVGATFSQRSNHQHEGFWCAQHFASAKAVVGKPAELIPPASLGWSPVVEVTIASVLEVKTRAATPKFKEF